MKLTEKIDELIKAEAVVSEKLDLMNKMLKDHEERLRNLERGYYKFFGILVFVGIVIDVVVRMVKF